MKAIKIVFTNHSSPIPSNTYPFRLIDPPQKQHRALLYRRIWYALNGMEWIKLFDHFVLINKADCWLKSYTISVHAQSPTPITHVVMLLTELIDIKIQKYIFVWLKPTHWYATKISL